MTDKKFTDKEIIEGLKCCGNSMYSCADNRCKAKVLGNALDLINRQKAEIERLKECPKCVYEYDGEITEYCVQGPCSNFKTVEQIKAEAYKEFAKRLKKETLSDMGYDVLQQGTIDNLLKEMVGEEE